jgi:hypothetical protein
LALGHRHHLLAVDRELDHRFRHRTDPAHRVEAAFDHHPETGHREEFGHPAQRPVRQKFEARIRAFIGIAGGLALLDDGDQLVELRIILADRDATPLERIDEVRLAALVGDHHLAEIADLSGDMLIGARILEQRRGMDAGLGGESRGADIGRLRRANG